MTTLGTLKERIATDITRSNLTAEIASAVTDAITDVEGEKYPFNTMPKTKPTVAGTQTLSVEDMVQVDTVAVIVDGRDVPLAKIKPRKLRRASAAARNQPSRFALEGNTLLLDPTPDKVYQIRVYGVEKAPALSEDTGTNFWTVEGEQLVRAVAKVKLWRDVIKEPEEVALALSAVREARSNLRKSGRTRMGTGRIFSYPF